MSLMVNLQLRPTLEVTLPWGAEEAMQRLRAAFKRPPLAGRVSTAGTVADFHVPSDERRLWSPHLSVQVENAQAGGSLLRARFSPRPEVWTAVMLFYLSVIFLTGCGLAYAYAQWAMDRRPWALSSLPVGVVLVAGIHVVSLVGQRLSSDQMVELRDLLAEAIERAGHSLDERQRLGKGDPSLFLEDHPDRMDDSGNVAE